MKIQRLTFLLALTWPMHFAAAQEPAAATPQQRREALDAQRDAMIEGLKDTRADTKRAEELAYAYLKLMHEAGYTTLDGLKAGVSYRKLRAALETHGMPGLYQALRDRFESFPVLATQAAADGSHPVQEFVLNKRPLFVNGNVYDAIRVKADAAAPFNWAFTYAGGIEEWFIVAQTGDVDGFKDFHNANRADWKGFAELPERVTARLTLQQLPAGTIVKERWYFLWFRIESDDELKIHATAAFKDAPNNTRGVGRALLKSVFDDVLPAAEAGDAEAQYKVGLAYARGRVVDKDYKTAFGWFQKAAAQNHAGAMQSIGELYHAGAGVERDDAQALEWCGRAADLKSTEAMDFIATMYFDANDPAKCAEWTRKAAELGNDNAQQNLAYAYTAGMGVPQDYAEAMKWYRRAADQNNRRAQTDLGDSYQKGLGVPQDDAEALKWLQLGAQDGFPSGEYHLAWSYYAARGVERDNDIAFHLIRHGADVGFPWAEYMLGLMHQEGAGTAQDFNEALTWLRKAGEHRNAEALYLMGTMYESGQGVAKDAAAAQTWFKRAAALGNVPAAEKLKKTEPAGNGDF